MKNIQLLVLQFMKWHKSKFLLLMGLNIFFGVFFNFYREYEFIQSMIILVLAVSSLRFYSTRSLIPASSAIKNCFSLKYYQSLPLSKTELMLTAGLIHVYLLVPLFMHVLVYHYGYFSHILLASLPIFFLFGVQSFAENIMYPSNGGFESKVKKKNNYASLKITIYYFTALILLSYSVFRLEPLLNINIEFYVKEMFRNFDFFMNSWFLTPLAVCAALFTARFYIKVLTDKKFYFKEVWKPKRDVPTMVICLLVSFLAVDNVCDAPPLHYAESPLLVSIHANDRDQVQELIKKGADLNQENKFGLTPLMAAAKEGHFEVYQLLKHHGAHHTSKLKPLIGDLEGANILHLTISGGNEKILKDVLADGVNLHEKFGPYQLSALHVAALTCQNKTIDLLLSKGAQVNALDINQRTPLHLSTRKNCIGSTLALLDQGADPFLKDKQGKVATDYLSKVPTEISSYLEKRTRTPATSEKN